MAKRLEGKVAVLTAAGAGIGRATAEAFLAEGARIVANPGCYPTAVQLGFLPLAGAGVVDLDHLIADAKRLIPLPDAADPKQLAMLTVNPPTASPD